MATTLCAIDDVPAGGVRGIDLGERRFIVLHQAGEIFVYRNQCPHLGVPLDWQRDQFMDSEGEFLRCAAHGALFLPETGECIAGPCVGQFLISVAFERVEGKIVLRK